MVAIVDILICKCLLQNAGFTETLGWKTSRQSGNTVVGGLCTWEEDGHCLVYD